MFADVTRIIHYLSLFLRKCSGKGFQFYPHLKVTSLSSAEITIYSSSSTSKSATTELVFLIETTVLVLVEILVTVLTTNHTVFITAGFVLIVAFLGAVASLVNITT